MSVLNKSAIYMIKKYGWIFVILLLAPFILLAPVLLGGKALFWGTPILQFVPWRTWAWQTLRQGHLPLWNPLSGMGAPLLANYQSALLYPPNWLYFLLAAFGGVPAMAWGQALLVGLHLAWAGAGMALLTRRLGLSALAQAVSGLSFGLCGYLVARAGFLSINSAVAWLPWVLLWLTPYLGEQQREKSAFCMQASGRTAFIGLSVSVAMLLLAGHAQTAWYTLLLAGLWAGFWGWYSFPSMEHSSQDRSSLLRSPRWTGLLRAELRLGMAVGLGVAVAAVQLLPTAEYLLQSQRASALDFEFALNYSTWPWHFLNLLAPDLFGNPAHGDYWGYANYWEDAMYIGLLPFLLALSVALRQAGRILGSFFQKKNLVHAPRTTGIVAGTYISDSGRDLGGRDQLLSRLSLFLLSLIAITVVLALGKNTPVFPWLYANVPTFDVFQAPARYLIWLEFALVLLAGMGLDQWHRPTGRALYWTRLATAGAIAVTVGAGLAWYLMGDIRPTFIQATALAGVWGVTAGGLSLLAPPAITGRDPGKKNLHQSVDQLYALRTKTHLWGYVVVVFVAVDLIVAGWGLNPGEKLDLFGGQDVSTANLPKLAEGGRLYLPEADEQVLKFERFFQFETFEPEQDWRNLKAVLLPNMNLLYGIASVNNFDPMVPGRFASWMETLEAAENPSKEWMMNLMGVRVVERVSMGASADVSFESRSEEGRTRARWTPCAVFVQDGKAALNQTLLSSSENRVVIEGKTPENQKECPALPGGAVQVISETPNQLVIQASAPTNGWLVVSDVWYPGWSARVDQRATSIWRANYLFRAVELPQGDHQVVLSYRPVSFWVGLIISVSAIMGMVVIFVLKIGRISSD